MIIQTMIYTTNDQNYISSTLIEDIDLRTKVIHEYLGNLNETQITEINLSMSLLDIDISTNMKYYTSPDCIEAVQQAIKKISSQQIVEQVEININTRDNGENDYLGIHDEEYDYHIMAEKNTIPEKNSDTEDDDSDIEDNDHDMEKPNIKATQKYKSKKTHKQPTTDKDEFIKSIKRKIQRLKYKGRENPTKVPKELLRNIRLRIDNDTELWEKLIESIIQDSIDTVTRINKPPIDLRQSQRDRSLATEDDSLSIDNSIIYIEHSFMDTFKNEYINKYPDQKNITTKKMNKLILGHMLENIDILNITYDVYGARIKIGSLFDTDNYDLQKATTYIENSVIKEYESKYENLTITEILKKIIKDIHEEIDYLRPDENKYGTTMDRNDRIKNTDHLKSDKNKHDTTMDDTTIDRSEEIDHLELDENRYGITKERNNRSLELPRMHKFKNIHKPKKTREKGFKSPKLLREHIRRTEDRKLYKGVKYSSKFNESRGNQNSEDLFLSLLKEKVRFVYPLKDGSEIDLRNSTEEGLALILGEDIYSEVVHKYKTIINKSNEPRMEYNSSKYDDEPRMEYNSTNAPNHTEVLTRKPKPPYNPNHYDCKTPEDSLDKYGVEFEELPPQRTFTIERPINKLIPTSAHRNHMDISGEKPKDPKFYNDTSDNSSPFGRPFGQFKKPRKSSEDMENEFDEDRE